MAMFCNGWWRLHSWSKWVDVARFAEQVRHRSEGIDAWRNIGEFIVQERRCEVCGLTQSQRRRHA